MQTTKFAIYKLALRNPFWKKYVDCKTDKICPISGNPYVEEVPAEQYIVKGSKTSSYCTLICIFEVSMRDGKPYVYSISRVEDDPETGKFWFLYEVKNNATTDLIITSPGEYVPQDGQHLVYWYRKGPWTMEIENGTLIPLLP
ncbi:uncharacterized protein CEXT_370661 [Caerostris extrusa]|uniref:Uncharacterized protein n=1 Tax=Caerostris extrusa TaxID=172846 RepID=A0AAV4P7Z7_CAEEX|nr:uncharacterized protein CEXT_370661 [Caerostris extrusa]